MLENENMIDLLGSLKEMSSEQLSRLIQEETEKEAPNDELVLMALDILEDREKESTIELGPKGKAAWKKYQLKVHSRGRNTVQIWKPIMQAASVVLVITLLFALLPTQANAETWWERLARWTDDFFSFFNPTTSEFSINEYVFQTDNEGLQQVYDTLVELGITEPIVPMWLPEGYQLVDLFRENMPTESALFALFSNGESEAVFHFRIISIDKPYQYHKDDTDVQIYEKYGTVYNVMKNNRKWSVIWTNTNIECSIFIVCQEEILYEIIESIYRWRIN